MGLSLVMPIMKMHMESSNELEPYLLFSNSTMASNTVEKATLFSRAFIILFVVDPEQSPEVSPELSNATLVNHITPTR